MRQIYVGFSLFELLIVIVIISILYGIMFASHLSVFTNMQDQVMRSQLLRAIHLAQTEAITHREPVFLEKSRPYWQSFFVHTREKILYTFAYHKPAGKLYWRAFPLNKQTLEFRRNGMLQVENGTFWYCVSSMTKPRWAIVINKLGRPREVLPDKWGNLENDLLLSCE